MPPFDPSWRCFLGSSFVDRWREKTRDFYTQEQEAYPRQANVFRAFSECPLGHLKVVIVGQAPYNNGNAGGLALSVRDGAPVPPSLWIVFSEIWREFSDVDVKVQHTKGNLVRWAQQGVLLLNSSLTIGQKNHNIKWESFTGRVLEKISKERCGIVFMLWGREAQKIGKCIVNNNGKHRVLCSSHPSPQSAWRKPKPFVGCNHFCEANQWLKERDITEINWA